MADYGKVKSGERVRRTVVVDAEDAKKLVELCREEDISLSEWVRNAMAQELDRVKSFGGEKGTWDNETTLAVNVSGVSGGASGVFWDSATGVWFSAIAADFQVREE